MKRVTLASALRVAKASLSPGASPNASTTAFVIALALALAVAGCSREPGQEHPGPEVIDRLKAYAEAHHVRPTDYVLSKFKDHDVVFLGEVHRVKHDVELVRDLIPHLYSHGICYLGTEFGRRVDQALIDSLIFSPEYDEALARRITLQQYVFWGFQEYVDIYRAAWQLNQSRPGNSPRFRILGLNNSPDWSQVKEGSDREKGDVMRKVWHGETEEDWARAILDSVVAKGEKILVYSGMHHAFTRYRQPIVVDGEFIRFGDVRMGNYVFDAIGDRAFSVFMHGPWSSAEGYGSSLVKPADGVIDHVMAELDPSLLPIGFDTGGTPFGELKAETSFYTCGYDDFTLSLFCDGYIYQKPLSEYEGVTPIPDFINEGNIDYARAQCPNPDFRESDLEDFNVAIGRHADLTRWRLR